MMGGQERFKHAREMGVGCGWTKIIRGIQGQRREVYGSWIASVVDRVKSKACRNE